MGNTVFPKFPGQLLTITKTPNFSTIVQRSASGKESRIALYSMPTWDFTLMYDHLRATEQYGNIAQVPVASTLVNVPALIANDVFALQGFFLGRQGAFDSWLFDDVGDDWIALQQIGLGDGSSTNFQLVRQIGEFAEFIQNPNGTPIQCGTWSPSLPVANNAFVIPTQQAIQTQGGLVLLWQTPGWPVYYQCTSPGTTGATEPYWRNAPVTGTTLVDGTVTWTAVNTPMVVYLEMATPNWAATTAYSLRSAIKPLTNNAGGYTFMPTVAGTSDGSNPTFPQTLGATVVDGGVTWGNVGICAVGVLNPIVPQHITTWTLGTFGLINFTVAPPLNQQVFCTTAFYFRCRFKSDTTAFEQFLRNIWKVAKLEFESIKL
jgi:hypothetical protein